MAFLIQLASGRNLTLTQVSAEILRIGRGTNQELRSENPAVALEHAVIESDAAGYSITDKGSITGTYVNRKPVETARLAKGDVVEIGDLRLEVQIAEPDKPLFIRVVTARTTAAAFEEDEEQAAVAAPGARVVRAKKIDYAGAYRLTRPWLTKVSVTAIVLIVAFGVIGELVRPERQTAFMPGGLSSAHSRARDAKGNAVADDCAACHTPWKSVSSNKCADCHAQPPHAMHSKGEPDCFACHAEHRGATKLATLADGTCTGCHANLGDHVRPTGVQRASLRFADGRYSFDAIARINAFGADHPELSYANDPNALRFNHQKHLAPKGVFTPTGKRRVLQCVDCHALQTVRDKSEPVAIDFERHCESCHLLTFDARFGNSQVPHGGSPNIVYGYVSMMYSGDRTILSKSADERRRILSTRRRTDSGDRANVAAEQVIKVKCAKCHDIERRAEGLAVTPPVIRTVWLDRARFTHGRHRTIDCEKCHQGARASVATSDVLMPRRENCTGCHASSGNVTVASTCVTCHEYHLRPPRQVVAASLAQAGMGGIGSGGRMLQGILLAVIVVLLLVVLVPVGIALFQRLRPERAPASPAPRPAPPPQQAPHEVPTHKIVRPDLPAGRAPKESGGAAPPDLAPAVASTRVLVIDPKPQEDAPAGTEMVQWNGLLHCTKGPLEGQRFVIEDDGFYIGRDPVLAKVVIADSRVSKRHVRILPRDGKVWAIDEGSTNGTFLKGQRITEVQLKRGDALVLGDDAATFVYQI